MTEPRIAPRRLTTDRAVFLRNLCRYPGLVWSAFLSEALAELDAVTKERDALDARCLELLEAANRAIADRDEALTKPSSGSYSGMNFIANRDGTVR